MHRARMLDRLGEPEPLEVARDERERAAAAARARRRRVKAGERGGQTVKLARRLELLLAAKVCHDTLAHPAALVAVALDQLDVGVAAAAAADGGLLEEHLATTLSAPTDRTRAEHRQEFAITGQIPGTQELQGKRAATEDQARKMRLERAGLDEALAHLGQRGASFCRPAASPVRRMSSGAATVSPSSSR